MPIKILRPDHSEIVGTGSVLLTSAHSAGPEIDDAGQIVEHAALASRVYAVIGKTGSIYKDSERLLTAHADLRNSIDTIIEENEIKCIISIYGKEEPGVDIGTNKGKTCTDETRGVIKDFLSRTFPVTIDKASQNPGPGSFTTGYEQVDSTGNFIVQSVKIGIGSGERQMQRDKVIDQLAELVGLLNVKLGYDPSRNSSSNHEYP